jgi:ABC-type lipoprotein export system ATPase subunit
MIELQNYKIIPRLSVRQNIGLHYNSSIFA